MTSRTLFLTLCLATVVAAPAASAQGTIEFGGFGTYSVFDESRGLRAGAGGGARLSILSAPTYSPFSLDAEASYSVIDGAVSSGHYMPARARLSVALPLMDRMSFLFGAGGVRTEYNDGVAADVEWGYTGLVGMRVRLASRLILRIDGIVDYMPKPVNEAPDLKYTLNQNYHMGIQVPLWTDRRGRELRGDRGREPERVMEPEPEAKPEPKPEPAPPQPTSQPAPQPQPEAKPVAQPDGDRDGVPDARDACANTASGLTVDAEGCPVYRDSDGDGIVDGRDACAGTPRGAAVDGRGCVPAPTAPTTPTPAPAAPAVRDLDDDGVLNTEDRCPGTPKGDKVDDDGCTVLFGSAVNSTTVTLRGVVFPSGRDELTASARAVLDAVAAQLIEMRGFRVEIAGHSDAQGAQTANLRLSLARAEAVRAYLVMKGVPAERLTARGYGPTKPIASNKTPAGRAQNRRVELRKID